MLERILQVLGVKTQRDAAKKLGITESSISQWKHDGTISIGSLLKIAELTNASLNWLLTGNGPQYLSDSEGTGLHVRVGEDLMAAISALSEAEGQPAPLMAERLISEALVNRGLIPEPSTVLQVVLYPHASGAFYPLPLSYEIANQKLLPLASVKIEPVAVELGAGDRRARGIVVRDSSLADADIQQGDLVICSEQYQRGKEPGPPGGSTVVGLLAGGRVVVGRIYRTENRVLLRAVKEGVSDLAVDPADLSVFGVVLGVQRRRPLKE
ncbi:MAG TPA: helix-turn-helix domain-containing protein [Blastocatellia bacterium]